MRRFVMVVQVLIARATTTTRCIVMVLTGCCTSTPLHVLLKQAANYSVSRIAGPVPAAQRRAGIRGIAPTSREVMTRRRSTAGASKSAGLYQAPKIPTLTPVLAGLDPAIGYPQPIANGAIPISNQPMTMTGSGPVMTWLDRCVGYVNSKSGWYYTLPASGLPMDLEKPRWQQASLRIIPAPIR
jgi:hypothetical protein